jgi:Flp pilus assembly protein TadG
MKPLACSGKRQRGAVAIMVGFSIFVLIGMLGLVLDLGRMFIIKTELQNGVDACALAAARELTGGDTDSLVRAEAAGLLVGGRNKVDFQRGGDRLHG